MIFHMFLGSIATVILNPEIVTVLEFEHRVSKLHSSIPSSSIYKKISRDQRTVVLKPLVPNFYGNVVVMTDGGTYNFDLVNGSEPHRSISVVNGINDTKYSLEKSEQGIKYFFSSSSILVKNVSGKSVKINKKLFKEGDHLILAKGPPVFLNNKRVRFE